MVGLRPRGRGAGALGARREAVVRGVQPQRLGQLPLRPAPRLHGARRLRRARGVHLRRRQGGQRQAPRRHRGRQPQLGARPAQQRRLGRLQLLRAQVPQGGGAQGEARRLPPPLHQVVPREAPALRLRRPRVRVRRLGDQARLRRRQPRGDEREDPQARRRPPAGQGPEAARRQGAHDRRALLRPRRLLRRAHPGGQDLRAAGRLVVPVRDLPHRLRPRQADVEGVPRPPRRVHQAQAGRRPAPEREVHHRLDLPRAHRRPRARAEDLPRHQRPPEVALGAHLDLPQARRQEEGRELPRRDFVDVRQRRAARGADPGAALRAGRRQEEGDRALPAAPVAAGVEEDRRVLPGPPGARAPRRAHGRRPRRESK